MKGRQPSQRAEEKSDNQKNSFSEELVAQFNLSDISDDDLPVPAASRRKRILIIHEANSDLARLKTEIQNLRGAKSDVASAHSVEEALAILAEGSIDLVTLQLDIPDCPGVRAVQVIHEQFPDTPIVVLAEKDDRNLAIESLKHGAQDYLCSDGINFDDMIDRVMQYSIERKRAEQVNHLALKLEKATIRSILEHSPMVMIRLDSNYRIVDCNASLERALKLPKDKIKRERLFDLIPELDLQGIKKIVDDGDNFKARVRLESIQDNRQEAMYWDVSGWPIIRSMAEIQEGIITATDVTREVYLEKERDEFIAALAHDLRNPVSGQTLVLNTLAKESHANLPPELGLAYEKLHQSSKETMWLLNNLLDLYHSGSVINQSDLAPVDIIEVMEEQLAQVSLYATVLGKSLQFEERDSARVVVDEISLHRLFSNLLHNAIRFSPPDTTINIRVKASDTTVTIKINNSGDPMDQEEIDNIFSRFNSSAPKDGQRNYQTRGLGLYLCRKIVDLYGGTISCSSNETEGTTFTVEFPLNIGESNVHKCPTQ